MKLIKITASLLALMFVVQAKADDNLPTRVPVNFSKIYSPVGFDDNDNVQIVGEGMFANSCYRHAETKVRVDNATKTIFLSPVAYKYNGYCLQVILPFARVIDVGILEAGTYSIVLESNTRVLGEVTARPSTVREADDYMYAPVSQAYFSTRDGVNKVFLSGEFAVSCMKLKEVKLNVQADVLVVQPIVELDKSVPCVTGKFPFESETLVGPAKPGHYLMHVRSMNGQSVNTLIDIK